MNAVVMRRRTIFGLLLALALMVTGCGQGSNQNASVEVADASHGDQAGHDAGQAHSHGGWWCAEHGVPEDDCSMCSPKAAAAFKAKGDWCEEHHRAESQCFICEPSRAERFAKLYEAKYGHPPPKR